MFYRIRALKEQPYTQKEAEAATGLRTDNGARNKPFGETVASQEVAMDVEIKGN